MKNLITSRVFLVAAAALVLSLACALWFYNNCGIQGLMAWQPSYAALFRWLFAVCLIPLLALVPWLILKNRPAAIISYVFSGVAAFVWLAIFTVLNVMNTLGTPAEKLNLLSADAALPVHAVASGDVETPLIRLGFGSDPHWGASHQNEEARTAILDGLSDAGNDAVFMCGDISDMGILGYYSDAIADLEAHLSDVPLRLLPGNHDALVCAIPHFKKMFGQQGEGNWYRMDGGSVHILVLCLMWDDHEFSRRQEKWLIEQLEDIPEDDTVIVLSHCYLRGSGPVSSSSGFQWGDIPSVLERICPILEKYHVDLAVSGHNHFFECLESGGTTYCNVGAMGGQLDKTINYISPESLWMNNTDFGWLEATVYTDRIELQFLDETGATLFEKTVR